jgi:Spy/CpxP family protein refolding chaperone
MRNHKESDMKRKLIAAAMAAALFAAPAWAESGTGMMGKGMMGGGMMGGGMMGGPAMGQGMMGGRAAINLTDEQRAKIADIRRDARKRIDAVLTDEQRAQLRSSSPCHAEERRS